jgi:hypothetical protein
MSRDEQERLRDIQDAIAAIHKHLEQTGETAAAKEDPLLHDALLFQFVVIGEAVKNLSPATRESTSPPRIPTKSARFPASVELTSPRRPPTKTLSGSMRWREQPRSHPRQMTPHRAPASWATGPSSSLGGCRSSTRCPGRGRP